jgi:hypothetical protein
MLACLALIDLLKKAMPDCDEETIFRGYHFISGAMTHNIWHDPADSQRVGRGPNGLVTSCMEGASERAIGHLLTDSAFRPTG